MSVASPERARDAIALAGLGAVRVSRADGRRKLDADRIMREAIALREGGLTWKQISPQVGASPSWLSLYAPPHLRYLSNSDLEDRRRASRSGESLSSLRKRRLERSRMRYVLRTERPRVVALVLAAGTTDVLEWARAKEVAERLESRTARRRMEELERARRGLEREREREREREARAYLRALEAVEARAMRSLRNEWGTALREFRAQEREARAQEREARVRERELRAQERVALRELRAAERVALREARVREREALREARAQERVRTRIRRYERGWESFRLDRRVVRLDAPLPESGESRHSLAVPLSDPFDPQRWVEAELLDSIVGDLSIADIQRMTDEELGPLRRKLIEAGFASGGNVQARERDRLRTPARHRGEAPPATFQPIHSKRRSRKDQVALMSGKRTSKKQRARWERDKAIW